MLCKSLTAATKIWVVRLLLKLVIFYSLQVANGNQISEIPVENLGSLPMLAVLDLSNNDIQHVPPLLGRVTQIRTLQLEGNPFRVPRPQIFVQGTQSIMQYLRNRIPADSSKEPA